MAYVGPPSDNSYTSFEKQTITGNGGQSYTLAREVTSSEDIEVYVNNVRQEPGVAYTASGTSLNMTGNVASTDSFYLVYQGKALQTKSVPDNSVGSGKLVNGAVTTNKIANGAITSAKIASGAVATSNILEVVPILADGQDITINGNTYNITGPTGLTGLSTTHTVIVGSSVSYTPPSGAVAVMYEFMFFPTFHDSYSIAHYMMRIGGTDIENSKISVSGTYNETPTLYRYIIPIGGTADANTGRQATWTTAKTLDVTGREYTSSYEGYVHGPVYWDGTGWSGTPFTPSVVITAFGAS